MEKQWNALIEQLRQPKNIIILVFLLGLVINGSLYLYRVMPQALPMHNLSIEYNELEKQRTALEKLPIPEKILPADINKLIEEVPISANAAAFLLQLKELESQSGVEIELISDGSNAKMDAANALITSEGKANLPNPNYSTQPKATAPVNSNSNETKSTTAPRSEAGFTEHGFEITIFAHYTQLMDFINRLKDLPRFVNVREWEFGDGSSESAGLNVDNSGLLNTPNDKAVKKRMKLKLSIYSAAQFKDKFPDLPSASIMEVPENRLDPTISDDQFNKLLESP
jgi:hypothetical protein